MEKLPCMDETIKTKYPQCIRDCSPFVFPTCHGFYLSSDAAAEDTTKEGMMEKPKYIEDDVWSEIVTISERDNISIEELIDDLLREALVNRMCLSI